MQYDVHVLNTSDVRTSIITMRIKMSVFSFTCMRSSECPSSFMYEKFLKSDSN